MTYSKRFPKDVPTQVHPQWIEVSLTKEEELDVEKQTRKLHASLLKQCVADAKQVAKASEVHAEPAEIVSLANALFDKRASHLVWHKEERAKQKFDESIS